VASTAALSLEAASLSISPVSKSTMRKRLETGGGKKHVEIKPAAR